MGYHRLFSALKKASRGYPRTTRPNNKRHYCLAPLLVRCCPAGYSLARSVLHHRHELEFSANMFALEREGASASALCKKPLFKLQDVWQKNGLSGLLRKAREKRRAAGYAPFARALVSLLPAATRKRLFYGKR